MSADTIVPDPTNPQALNRYSYVLNNPVKYTDPTGHGFLDSIGDLFSDVWDAIKSVKEKVERFYNTPEVKFAIAVIMIANGVGEVGDPTAGILNLTKAAHDLVNTSNQSSDIGFYGQSGSSGRYLTDGGSPISASAPGNRDAKGSGYSYFHPSFYSQASGVLSDVSSGFLRTNIGAITRALNVSKWFELRERAFDPFNNKESYKHRKAHW
ncbi:MAG: RHS repeat-associated core domain-containing protein, partial [Planctomycetota bacterium]